MRVISTKVHGIMDYAMGVILIVSPWLFAFSNIPTATNIVVALGIGLLVYSLITKYELSWLKIIPMGGHLTLDFISGVLLVISPWVFGFAPFVYLPHVILGVLEMIAVVLTDPRPGHYPIPHRHTHA